MNHDLTVQEYIENKQKYIPIDVRSPGEYEENRIPEAISVPLFTNEERAEVGTIYKQIGKKEAKWRAMEIVSGKLPDMLGKIKQVIESGYQPIVYCWRGGMRSQSVTLFATMSGLDNVVRLSGGYRAYREYILESIPSMIPERAVVIDGMTGTGKTDILDNLKHRGYPVLDLEKYANHKGSVFGAVQGQTPHNQKMFDALLYEDLKAIEGSPYFFMEGESKRIGHAVQPIELYEKKNTGIHIRVNASLDKRVERIYEQYVVEDSVEFHNRVEIALKKILKRVKPIDIQNELKLRFQEKNYKEIIRLLILYYYDPRYDNKMNEVKKTELEVNCESVDDATDQIIAFVEQKLSLQQT